METQFQYIVKLAERNKIFVDNPPALYEALSNLNPEILKKIAEEYASPENSFKPVNILRSEIARLLLSGIKIDDAVVEELKKKIVAKDIPSFAHLSPGLLEELKSYPIGSRDMFANWQKPWGILYSFFYNRWSTEKETTLSYLEQIASSLIEDLDLEDYTFHKVDFQGPSNFGSDYCWLALYPTIKNSHQDAYQFFAKLSSDPQAGLVTGHSIKNGLASKYEKVSTYREAVEYFKKIRQEVIDLNKKTRNFFKDLFVTKRCFNLLTLRFNFFFLRFNLLK